MVSLMKLTTQNGQQKLFVLCTTIRHIKSILTDIIIELQQMYMAGRLHVLHEGVEVLLLGDHLVQLHV